MSTILRELPFGSLFAYSPKGSSAIAKQSQRLCHELKRDGFTRPPSGDPATSRSVMRWLAERIVERRGRLPFADYFSADVTLVPMPTHARQKENSLWVPMRICEELCRAGLAGSVSACLIRKIAVPKAAQSRPEARPTVDQHLSSMTLERGIEPLEDLLLVDDVVTRGATLMAASLKIREAFPLARVRAFAVLRTFSDSSTFTAIDAPVAGTIHLYESGKTHREP
jgi:hypothetical protein